MGYIIANMKSAADVKIGDTYTDYTRPCPSPLPGFKEIRPMVFSGIYPVDSSDFEALKAAMAKLQINDAAFSFQAESSVALGFGFRCGFLACSTWKSSRSACAGNSTWTSSPPIPP